jgi:hypothetical protein
MHKVDPETAKLLRGYSDAEWLTWYNGLVVIAKRECAGRYWRTGRSGHLPKGYTPETIAQEAIKRLFTGERQWNQDEYPGPTPFGVLRATVESIVSDLVRSPEHKRLAYLEEARSGEDDDGDSEAAEKAVHHATQDVQPASGVEEAMYFRDVISRIRERIEGRSALVAYFDCLLDGLKRGEIAKRMKVAPTRVDEIRKQFWERTEDIYCELFGGKSQGEGGA